jgi:hypothetical protein
MGMGDNTVRKEYVFIPHEDVEMLLKKAGIVGKVRHRYCINLKERSLQIIMMETRYGIHVENVYNKTEIIGGMVITNPIAKWNCVRDLAQ